jgi:hypothetical protein
MRIIVDLKSKCQSTSPRRRGLMGEKVKKMSEVIHHTYETMLDGVNHVPGHVATNVKKIANQTGYSEYGL